MQQSLYTLTRCKITLLWGIIQKTTLLRGDEDSILQWVYIIYYFCPNPYFLPTFGRKSSKFCPNQGFLTYFWTKIASFVLNHSNLPTSANKSSAASWLWTTDECIPFDSPFGEMKVCTTPRGMPVTSINRFFRS